MKTRSAKLKTLAALLMLLAAFFVIRNYAHGESFDPGVGQYTVSIPASIESRLVNEAAENTVIYKFKKADGSLQFLFSINKVSYEQWTLVRSQIPEAKLLGQKDGTIYYAELTTRKSMKDADKQAYAEAVGQLDAIVQSIKF